MNHLAKPEKTESAGSGADRPALLTTGQAAKLCSVTPDTVLKWINSGKLQARKTVGGHNRIPRENLLALLGQRQAAPSTGENGVGTEDFRFCWEFYAGEDGVQTQCRECLVYRSQAARCFEMSHLPADSGYKGTFCDLSCSECEYYQQYRPAPIRVLVVTNSAEFEDQLRDSDTGRFEFRFTNCEYDCSALVGSFRPECVVVDCTLATEECEQLCYHLSQDPRLREGKILLARSSEEVVIPRGAAGFPHIDEPVTADSLQRRIEEVWSPGVRAAASTAVSSTPQSTATAAGALCPAVAARTPAASETALSPGPGR